MPSLPFVLDLTALPRAALQGEGGEPGLDGPADRSEVVFSYRVEVLRRSSLSSLLRPLSGAAMQGL